MTKSTGPKTEQPDILEVVYWLNTVSDPVERIRQATLLGDEARDQLLPELASVRRLATVQARKALMEQGMSATAATHELANQIGMSVQTVMRMITEAKHYGG
jgi:hypothetical protein